MCMCEHPNVNGTPNAYSWNNTNKSTRPVDPPELRDGDELLYDEPGRCGGLDCHSHHFRLVKSGYGGHDVLVRHGGGDERVSVFNMGKQLISSFAALDSNGRYWMMHALYSTHSHVKQRTADEVRRHWQQAAAEKRIKTRKARGHGTVKVWIEPAKTVQLTA